MRVFTGADIIDISRFNTEQMQKQSFLKRCFTSDEQEYCLSKANPAQHFAVRFAAKEAVIKAVSGLNKTLFCSEIEIKNRADGRPYAVLHSEDAVLKNLGIDVSLSHSNTSALAFAVVYCD